MEIIHQYKSRAKSVELCHWVGLPRSVFYCHPRPGRPGAKPSIFTLKRDGSVIRNEVVVDHIRMILNQEFCCYGC